MPWITRVGCRDRPRSRCPLQVQHQAAESYFFVSFSSPRAQAWIWHAEKFLAPLLYSFLQKSQQHLFLPALILLPADPTVCFPLIWDTYLWAPNQQNPDGTAASFPSLNRPQVVLTITHVTCPCKKPRTTKKSFITSHVKILSSSEWLFFFFRSKNIFCQLRDDFKRPFNPLK